MKRLFIYCVIVLSLADFSTSEGKTSIFVTTAAHSSNKSYQGNMESFVKFLSYEVANALENAYPCCEVSTISDVITLLDWERRRQLLTDVPDDSKVKEIGRMMDCKYLVSIKVKATGETAVVDIFCVKSDMSEYLARVGGSYSMNTAVDQSGQLIDEFMKQLADCEICPYKGKVKIDVKSDREETSQASTPAGNCSGSINTTTTVESHSTLKWDLDKKGLRQATGTSNYDLKEKITIEINHPCYKCDNGIQGAVQIIDTNESEATVEGLSTESVFEGAQVSDARIKIQFLDDGTYFLHIKATSEDGKMKVTTEKKINGACENESEPPKPIDKKISVPVNAVFGPFKGTTKDKILHDQKEEDISKGEEKATVKIDFTLTMEE